MLPHSSKTHSDIVGAVQTINNGTFLAITSPNTPRTFQRAYGGEIGDVYFLDITKIDEYGFLNPKYVATLDASKLTQTRKGLSPRYITSGTGNGEFLLSNVEDHNNGLMTVKLKTDSNGQLTGDIEVQSVNMTPSAQDKNRSWYNQRLQLNLQSAAASVLVEFYDSELGEYVEYAIVADAFNVAQDPHWNWDDGYGAGKQMGAKLAVVRDPFNKVGKFEFLGTTTPINGGIVESLYINQDGKLFGKVWIDEPIENGWRLAQHLLVWDASSLISTALAHKEIYKEDPTLNLNKTLVLLASN